MIERYLKQDVLTDALADSKMAFITGPRQVGKSTLAGALIDDKRNCFIYDNETFRRAWAKSPESAISERAPGPIVLDEIHKDRRWKTKVKGIYDAKGLPIIVTGSARFDYFRKGSDSLLGRYIPYRLHPFTVAESPDAPAPEDIGSRKDIKFPWEELMFRGGFPEPLLKYDAARAQRWSRLRLDRLVLEDSRDFRNISDLNAFRVLIDLMPERVGSLLSINSLKRDVDKAYATVRSWVQILHLLYFCFSIKPYSKKISRALKSEPKLYLYDILSISADEKAKRTENLAALHLHKACQYWTDTAKGEFTLQFVRDKEGREVDFLITRNKKPWMLIECKSNSTRPSKSLKHFTQILRPKLSVQLVTTPKFDRVYDEDSIRVLNYESFFAGWV